MYVVRVIIMVLQVNLWYDFLEPRNQDVHNVMTQVTELFKYYVLEIPFTEELWQQCMQVDQRK